VFEEYELIGRISVSVNVKDVFPAATANISRIFILFGKEQNSAWATE
jgi:ABC-type phosphate/phosphonate transport system ATPase subunit